MFTKRREPARPDPDQDGENGSPAAHSTRGDAEQKKGRATPTRKEAEKARKDRLKYGTSSAAKGSRREQRAQRARNAAREREALRSGDETNMPARDRGPVRRFCRDYVDSRRTFGELLIPLMLAVLILSFMGAALGAFTSLLALLCFVLLAFDMMRVRRGLRRQLAERFPEEPMTGTTGYTLMRATQMRFLRMPKPRVKPGDDI